MKTIRLTQANTNCPVEIGTTNIFYCYYSEAHKATHIVANGGAYLAVLESLDEVTRLIRGTQDAPAMMNKKEGSNE